MQAGKRNKYGIWRHENALGNSAEHTIGLCKHLMRVGDTNPLIYVEKEFQKAFALCIPGISPENIVFFEKGIYEAVVNKTIADDPRYSDISMPNVYGPPALNTYPASWADLVKPPDCTLRFPEEYYENKHQLPEGAIVIQVRESNTYWKRAGGANEEPHRSVHPQTFFRVAQYFADKGHTVVRIGDSKQTPFPEHKNIIDFALTQNRSIFDDLYVISKCKVFLSCDSALWPIAGAMKKNLVLSNVTSVFGYHPRVRKENGAVNFILKKPEITDWLPKTTTKILYKKAELVEKADIFLKASKVLQYKIYPTGSISPPYILFPFANFRLHHIFNNLDTSIIVEIKDNSFEELVEAVGSFYKM